MTAKLTPRVGDRVLVKVSVPATVGLQTRTGSIIGESSGSWRGVVDGYWRIAVDGVLDDTWTMHSDDITVLDRDPVEWPEGWARFSQSMVSLNDARTFSRSELEDILATGPDMLARWDELFGGEA